MKIQIINIDVNKYEENSPEWHCALDLTYFEKGSVVTLIDLFKAHKIAASYYENYLPVLELDGQIKIEAA